MKKLILLSLMSALFSFIFAGVSHSVYVELFRSDGIEHPAEGDVSFDAYITIRPDDVKTESDFGFDYYESAPGFIQCNVGNFDYDWSQGEILCITATELSTGDTATKDFLLTSAGFDYFPEEDGMQLEACLEAPIVQISQDGINVTLNWNSVTGATSYTVYSDPASDGSFATIEQSGIIETSWIEALSADRKFYRVTSSNTSRNK